MLWDLVERSAYPDRSCYNRCCGSSSQFCPQICIKYSIPDAVPPIHAKSYHVATDKDPSKFRSIFSDNLQPVATRVKKARGTLLVDIGCSSKRAPPPLVITTKLAAAILVVAIVRRRGSVGPVLPLWFCPTSKNISYSACYKCQFQTYFCFLYSVTHGAYPRDVSGPTFDGMS